MTSASMTVLASDSLSLDESHTSSTTPVFIEDIGCGTSDTHEDHTATTKSLNSKSVPNIFLGGSERYAFG
jgi:hypothetical protein